MTLDQLLKQTHRRLIFHTKKTNEIILQQPYYLFNHLFKPIDREPLWIKKIQSRFFQFEKFIINPQQIPLRLMDKTKKQVLTQRIKNKDVNMLINLKFYDIDLVCNRQIYTNKMRDQFIEMVSIYLQPGYSY